MSRIEKKFAELKRKKEGVLIGYLTLGDPNPEASATLVKALCEYADIVELGIPFSDPIADGPTIQAAIDKALKAGMNTAKAFEIVKKLKKDVETPFVFMTYYNIVLQYGEEKFLKRCKETGIDGVLITDLPVEEGANFISLCRKHSIDFVSIITLLTDKERIKKIAKNSTGFLYLVSLLGVTGARDKLAETAVKKTREALACLKEIKSPLPLAIGFGISKKEHVREIMKAGAQGVVVGSAFVKLIEEKKEKAAEEIKKLARELKSGTA